MFLLLLLPLRFTLTWAEASDGGNYIVFKNEVDEFFKNRNSPLLFPFDEPSHKYIEVRAKIHEKGLQVSRERDKLALEKRRLKNEIEWEKRLSENDIKKLAFGERRLER